MKKHTTRREALKAGGVALAVADATIIGFQSSPRPVAPCPSGRGTPTNANFSVCTDPCPHSVRSCSRSCFRVFHDGVQVVPPIDGGQIIGLMKGFVEARNDHDPAFAFT